MLLRTIVPVWLRLLLPVNMLPPEPPTPKRVEVLLSTPKRSVGQAVAKNVPSLE
jgi:hypothetical protein